MLKLKKVAVTGAISSGKSTVCRFLKELGAYTVSADEIVHKLLSPHSLTGQKVLELLGQNVIQHNNINRQKVAEKVFNDPDLLKALEAILHPAVSDEIRNEYAKAEALQTSTCFVAEVPLLFEAHMEKEFDAVIAIDASDADCLAWHIQAGGSKKSYEERMRNQFSGIQKLHMAPYHLKNNGDLEQLKIETAKLYQQLI